MLPHAALLLALLSPAARAQQPRASAPPPTAPPAPRPSRAEGRVVRAAGADSLPLAGARVVLHRVGRQAQGPIDSGTTDAAGRFRFRFAADTASLYLVSARWSGIEYFSSAVHTNPLLPDTALTIGVADTSSSAPVALTSRHIVVGAPGADGSRGVLELIVLDNHGVRARVAADTVAATWGMLLPPGALGFTAGEGDFSPDALIRRNDSVVVFAPIAPGEKQFIFQYTLPGDVSDWTVPFDQPAGSVNLMLEERGARAASGLLAYADTQDIQGHSYRRFTGRAAAGSVLRVSLPNARSGGRWALAGLVAAVAVVLLGAAWWLASGRARPRPVPAAPPALARLDAIAALDARYAGREAAVPPDEWRGYLEQRARLKGELEAALAAGGVGI